MILSGPLRSIGVGILQGAELAAQQRSQTDLARRGLAVRVLALDYGVNGVYSPAKGIQNARIFLANPSVFAEDGPYNSGLAKASMPVYNQGDMVQISPGNTLPDLTYPSNLRQLQPATAAGRHGRTYFRDCTTDAFQGPAGAEFARTHFHPRTGYIVNDWGLPGIGLADAYQRSLPGLGIRVLGRAGLSQSNPGGSANAAVAKIKRAHPAAVFFGGEPDTGGITFANALRNAGVHVPLIGGDALYATDWIRSNGHYNPGSQNSWFTVIGPNPLADPRARGFTAAYRARFHIDPTPFSVLSYDAANLEITGLEAALSGGRGGSVAGLREAVRAYVQHAHYRGVGGAGSFDRNGDTTNKVIGIWRVNGTGTNSFQWLGYAPGFAPR